MGGTIFQKRNGSNRKHQEIKTEEVASYENNF